MATSRAARPASLSVLRRHAIPAGVEDERDAHRERLEAEIARVEEAAGLTVPELARFKPPLKSLRFGSEGRLWVGVAMPSTLKDGVWSEATAFDVFEPDGRFVGRVVFPESFMVFHSRRDELWGVHRDAVGVESVRRYRVRW